MANWKRHSLNATEVFRAAAEFGQYVKGVSALLRNAPKGDGHPVLVIPPFTGNDAITHTLRKTLEKAGYAVYGWDNGHDFGFNDEKAMRISERLKDISEENGGQKVSVIGWSLGGIWARELAREYPEMVRDVTSLFTPFGIGGHKDATPPLLVATIQLLSDSRYSLQSEGMAERLVSPPEGIPTTSIFSKEDGIGGWKACLNPKSSLAEKIQVEGSHLGAAWNLEVFSVLLDRLAQKEGQWKPFENPSANAPDPDPSWQKRAAGKWRFFPKR
jgi:triacylglycerol esterase/lipase EstA (alpha/beta hydrolase family)